MRRSSKEPYPFNVWKNKERLTGRRTHKPLPERRQPTLQRVADKYEADIREPTLERASEQEEYIIKLSPLAFQLVQQFAEREILAEQYTNWESVKFSGVDNPSDEDVLADEEMQEIAFQLMNLVKGGAVAIGGLKVIYDSSASEIITVADAESRGYTDTYAAGANSSDLFLVVHVNPATALVDSNYGNDIARADTTVGSLVVQDGKLRRYAPRPDFQFDYAGGVLPLVQSVQSNADGQWVRTQVAIPVSIGGSSGGGNPNCCLPSANPPSQPPTPPTPPNPPPSTPPTPTPNPPITSDTVCSVIFSDNGRPVDIPFLDLFFSMIAYSNVAIGGLSVLTIYPVNLGTLITTWLTANVPDFDQSCDTLLSLHMKLTLSLADNGIFGFIPNPFGSPMNTEPALIHKVDIDSSTYQQEVIFYFPIDRKVITPITNSAPYPTFGHDFYENEYEVAIRYSDRVDGIGYEKWAFAIDKSEYHIASTVTPLQLWLCKATYRKHQYLFSFKFDGSDTVKIEGTQTYIYDIYGNARIPVATGYFEANGFDISTDAVHPFNIAVDMKCDAPSVFTQAVLYGSIKMTHSHWGDATQLSARIEDGFGHTVGTTTQTLSIPADGSQLDFTFLLTGSFDTSHVYQVILDSGSFPNDTFKLLSLSGYFA